jgi:hypothetical protein
MSHPAFCLLPTAFCLLPSAYCLLPSAYCLLPTAYCLLPSAYCLPYNYSHSVQSQHSAHGRLHCSSFSIYRHYVTCLRSSAFGLPSTAYCLRSTAFGLRSTAYCLLPSVFSIVTVTVHSPPSQKGSFGASNTALAAAYILSCFYK